MRSNELCVTMMPSHSPLAIFAVRCLRRSRVRSSLPAISSRALSGQVAGAGDAVAVAVERVPTGPGSEHHLGTLQEVPANRNFHAFDGQGRNAQPLRVRVVRGVVGRALPQEEDVGHDRRAFALESVRGEPDRADEIRLGSQVLAHGGVLLVEREVCGDQCEDAAGLQGIDRPGEEVVVQRQLPAAEGEFRVGERHVADHAVHAALGQARVAEVLDADVLIGVEGAGDAAERRSSSMPMKRYPGWPRLMKLPVPQPGSRMRALP